MPLIDPVYRIRPNRYDGIRRSWDQLGELGLVLEHLPAQIEIVGQQHTLDQSAQTLTLSHTPAGLVIEGQVHELGQIWRTIPNQTTDGNYPYAIEGLKATYLVEPEKYVVTVHDAEGSENDLVESEIVSYDDETDTLTVTENPQGKQVFLRATLTAEADWQERISGPGVVWYHDFRTDAEVDAFRWSGGVGGGNDPGALGNRATDVRRITTDGVTGACLECVRRAGTTECAAVWWRMFSPIQGSGNGKGVDDPAANGSLTVRAFAPTQGGSQSVNHSNGWYGHPNYHTSNFDGHDFYLQIRVKMDPRRITGGNQSNTVGKFVWFTTIEGGQSLSNAEHVFWSYGHGGNQGTDKNYLRAYVLGVNGIGPFDPLDQAAPGSRIQPGSAVAEDWYYSGGWDCLLFHLRPGLINTSSGDDATRLEIWAATEAAILSGAGYTKIWDQTYGVGAYEARNGLQALILGTYNNGNNMGQEFWHRYCQVIFSREFIPCPRV